MKKVIAALITATILVAVGVTPARADERAFQYSGPDKQTPAGMTADFNITEVQAGINADDEFEIYVLTKGGVRTSMLQGSAEFLLYIDTDLDKVADYTLTSKGENSVATMSARSLTRKDGTVLPDCQAYGWPTSNGDAYGWQVPKSCIFPRETINFYFTASQDGSTFDRYPDGSKWWNIKTNFFKAEPCASYLNGDKRTYLGTKYVCKKSGGSWKWMNWGKIAAAQSKYKTEKAFYICNLGNKAGALLEDSGRTLTLDGAYKYIITESDFNCVTNAMGVPASVLRKIAMTRALDGTLDARWSNINAFWNYHPDSGLNITFSYN